MGQVIGETDRTASYPIAERFTPANLMSTILHTVFDAAQARIMPEVLGGELANLMERAESIGGLL